MQVTPSRTHLSQDFSVFEDILIACHTQCRERNLTRVVSFSMDIPTVDPLAVMQEWHDAQQHFFYWEQPSEQIAIAAITPEISLKTNRQRFRQTQHFIDCALKQAMIHGNLEHPFSGPHFFCGFTFFEETETNLFPSGLSFLPRWQIVRHRQKSLLVANFSIHSKSNIQQLFSQLTEKLDGLNTQVFKVRANQTIAFQKHPQSHPESIRASVGHALQLIKENKLEKLVLAHPLDIETTLPLPLDYTLDRLRQLYPECYIFAVGNGKGQTFWGASPEKLVGLSKGKISSDVLAGSAPRGETVVEDISLGKNLLNNRKDGHEHQLVLDFICNQFKVLGMDPQVLAPAHLMQLANIQHLHTPVSADAPPHLKLLAILAALHPTPAVAGTPHDRACGYIRQYETFDRHLYAAPLGWINHKGDGEFAVGIRSALSDGKNTRVYAGAGIVAGSEPTKELAEVELKLQTLIEALI
jgi:menaquinone-specific isochorismate synthase